MPHDSAPAITQIVDLSLLGSRRDYSVRRVFNLFPMLTDIAPVQYNRRLNVMLRGLVLL
jgi:hypothetical protein